MNTKYSGFGAVNKQLLQQAYDYIDNVPDDRCWGDWRDHERLAKALLEAIAAPEPEPAATYCPHNKILYWSNDGGKGHNGNSYIEKHAPPDWIRLYIAPPDAEALRKELERVTVCLKQANESAEKFEREWYLRGDELERVKEERDAMAVNLVAIRDCLKHANEKEHGPICDTIWYSRSETLFDYIDSAIAAQGGDHVQG